MSGRQDLGAQASGTDGNKGLYAIFMTLAPSGFPVAAPVVAAYYEPTRTFFVSSSIAYSSKVRNLRRNPIVVLFLPEGGHLSTVGLEGGRRNEDLVAVGKAEVADVDFEQALWAVASRFREVKTQPGLYRRLRHSMWRRLYRYYFTRYLIAISPLSCFTSGTLNLSDAPRLRGAIDEGSPANQEPRWDAPRPAVKLPLLSRRLLRRCTKAVAFLVAPDSEGGLRLVSCRRVQIQTVGPTVIRAGLSVVPTSERRGEQRRKSTETETPLASSAATNAAGPLFGCIVAYEHSEDFSQLRHVSVYGMVSLRGSYLQMAPTGNFITLRPGGVLGDLWTGLDSFIKGRRVAEKLHVEPISLETLDRSFGKRPKEPRETAAG
jgi:hypothetical protein